MAGFVGMDPWHRPAVETKYITRVYLQGLMEVNTDG